MARYNHADGHGGWEIEDFGSAQTDTVLVAGAAGRRIEVLAWKFSTDTAQTLTLEDEDDTLVDRQYAAANGGQIARLGFHRDNKDYGVLLPENKDLVFTSSAAGNVTVGVLFRVVDA